MEEALLLWAGGLLELPGAAIWRWLGTHEAVGAFSLLLVTTVLWRDGRAGWRVWGRRLVVLALVLGAADGACTWVLKPAFGRARPCMSYPVAPGLRCGRDFSFPSGHATTTAAAAALLGGPGLAGCAAAVGVSRVVLGQHWPGDVLAGWLLGAALGRAGRRLAG